MMATISAYVLAAAVIGMAGVGLWMWRQARRERWLRRRIGIGS